MRPLGVTLVGFYQILRGVLGLLFGLSLLLFTSLAVKLAALASEGNATGRFFAGFGHLASLVIIVVCSRSVARRLRSSKNAKLGPSAHPVSFRGWPGLAAAGPDYRARNSAGFRDHQRRRDPLSRDAGGQARLSRTTPLAAHGSLGPRSRVDSYGGETGVSRDALSEAEGSSLRSPS